MLDDSYNDKNLARLHARHLMPDDAVEVNLPLRTVRVTVTYVFEYEGVGDLEDVADNAKAEARARLRKGDLFADDIKVEEIV